MRKSTKLLRSALAIACCVCGMQALAQTEIPSAVASGGVTNSAICCTVGETFVGVNAGLWAEAVPITSGIDAVYDNGEVVVENSAGDASLNIQLSDEILAAGASYNIYTLEGLLVDSNRITESPYSLKYDQYLTGKCIIVTVQVGNAVIGTYKLAR